MYSMESLRAAYAREEAMPFDEFYAMMRRSRTGASPAQEMEAAFHAEVLDSIDVPGGVVLSLPVALHSFADFHPVQIPAGD